MLIETTLGLMESEELDCTTGDEVIPETDTTGPARLRWVEYRHEGVIVHRSVEIILDGPMFKLSATQATF